jgi:phage terminase small subunit
MDMIDGGTRSSRPRRFFRPISTDRPLSARERRFVGEYLVDLKAEQAAIRAGYSSKTARVQASQVLTRPNVQAALEAGYKERQARTQMLCQIQPGVSTQQS